MKRGFAVVFVFAWASWLSAGNLVSRPVGVARITVAPGEQKLVSIPFQAFDNAIGEVLKGQLTGASREEDADVVLKWDSAIPDYLRAMKADGTGNAEKDGRWFQDFTSWTLSNMTLDPGEGFFICNRQAVTQQVVLCGEVVLEDRIDLLFAPGLTLFGFPFTAGIDVEDAGLDKESIVGRPDELQIGIGHWYYRQALEAIVWNVRRPYANPFPANDDPPRITDIACLPRGVTLSIAVSGAPGERVDIYVQDLQQGGRLAAERGWRVAALDIETRGRKELLWHDDGELSAEAPARIYLVARSDADGDFDGIPDSRKTFLTMAEQERAVSEYVALKERGVFSREVPPSTQSQAPMSTGNIVYVDRVFGHDGFSGRLRVATAGDGPKMTIRAGLAEARPGDTLVIGGGSYGEPLNVAGKGVPVRIAGHVDLTKRK